MDLLRKFVFIFLMFFSISFSGTAQNLGKLWGLTSFGGKDGSGVLLWYDQAASKDSVVLSFSSSPGSNAQYGKLLLANDGNYYGMTSNSFLGDGIIFKYTPTGDFAVMASFSGGNGAFPYGSLIQASDGNLYGMTQQGAGGFGVIFKFDLSMQTLSTIYKFDNFTGDKPTGSLIQAQDGYLYGMTHEGLAGSAIFKCLLDGSNYSTIHAFTNNETPYGSLIQGSDGNLYGMTYGGGVNTMGTIFQCSTDGSSFNTLIDFDGTNGAYPYGSLVEATDGNLYGLASSGGTTGNGTIFQCTLSGILTKLVDFDGSNNGATPTGDLFEGTDGNLYGVTSKGGSSDNGTIFKCTTSGSITTLVNFSNGEQPMGSLIQMLGGELIGLTNAGGKLNNGLIFKCTTTGTLISLHDFGVTKMGGNPFGNVIQARDGNLLYGMTSQGGSWNGGTIFRYNISAMQTDTLVSFNKATGTMPGGSLLELQDGNFYGMTYSGGTNDSGTVFKCSPTGVITVLVNLNNTLGGYPNGSFVQAEDGNLYGMTSSGGAFGIGTIIKYDTTSHLIDTLLSFNGSNGSVPYGSLLLGNDGFLYGMTSSGGSLTNGNIFKCNTSGIITSIADLNDFGVYTGDLIQDANGDLYGLAFYGGANNGGYIFKCTTSGTLTSIYDFPSGSSPYGGLILGTDGNFYGMTNGGGTYGWGTIFKYTPGGVFTTLLNFDNSNGNGPGGNLMEAMDVSISKTFDCVHATTLSGVVTGGLPPYTYKWSNNANTSSINEIISTGTYTLTVRDSKGVTLIASANTTAYQAPDVSTSVNANSIQANAAGSSYQWIDCNQASSIIAGETNQIFSPTISGNYAVIVNANGCSDTSSCVPLTVTNVLTANELSYIKISPNPTSGVLMLEAAQAIEHITITDLAGEVILDITPDAGVSSINLQQYHNGMYFIHFKMNGEIHSMKFVLEK